MKILIVDDEHDIRESLGELFEDEGYTVARAVDGADALAQLEKDQELPAIVLLDLVMPRMGGAELYERMQADPRLAKVPVIVSTSDPSRAPDGVLILKKPLNIDRLLDAVQQRCG